MSYITHSDIERRLGRAAYVHLSDDDGDGQADESVVEEARAAAEGELDSYLAFRHATPIDLVAHPELAGLLRSAALDLAEYRLRLRRPPAGDDARRRRDEVIEWLRRVAEGTVSLPSTGDLPGTISRGPVAESLGSERALSREELESH